MKKALILYWHGLGDVIMLTPHMRYLYNKGYKIDLMCRDIVRKSHLLDHCPYVNELIEIESPWRDREGKLRTPRGFTEQAVSNTVMFERMSLGYHWSGMGPHNKQKHEGYHKIDMTSAELGVELKDKQLEIFISEEAERKALDYIKEDFIFRHTVAGCHPYHNWDAGEWIRENLPPYRIINAIDLKSKFDDINVAFALARRAKHRVLVSSVFVYACEAMGCTIDAVNYGRAHDRYQGPLNQSLLLHIREEGKWIK